MEVLALPLLSAKLLLLCYLDIVPLNVLLEFDKTDGAMVLFDHLKVLKSLFFLQSATFFALPHHFFVKAIGAGLLDNMRDSLELVFGITVLKFPFNIAQAPFNYDCNFLSCLPPLF